MSSVISCEREAVTINRLIAGSDPVQFAGAAAGAVEEGGRIPVVPVTTYASGAEYELLLHRDHLELPQYPETGDGISPNWPPGKVWSWRFSVVAPDVGSPPELQAPALVTGVNGSVWRLELAGDGSGNGFAVIWSDELDSMSPEMWDHIYAVPITACTAGTPVQLVFDAGDRGPPALAMNSSGEAIAAGPYQNLATNDHGIWIQHFDPVTGWAAATSPPAPTHADPVKSVQVGIASNGDGVVSYLAPPPTASDYWHIEYTTYTSSTDTWSTPVALSTSVDLKDPCLAVSDAGAALVVAVEDQSGGGVVYACLGSGGGHIAPTTGYTASQVRLDMNGDGEAFVIWREANAGPTDTRIRAARIVGCSAPTPAYADGGGGADLSSPDVVVASDGSATATWVDHQGVSGHDLVANRYLEASGWGTTQVVMNSTAYLMDTQAAVSPTGQVTVLSRSSMVGEVSTRMGDGSWSPEEDETTIADAISLQIVDDARLLYLGSGQLVVGFVTNIGGIQDAGLTLCR